MMKNLITKSFLCLFFICVTFKASTQTCTNQTLWGWGEGGNLGDGTGVNKVYPTQINESTDWKLVNAGFNHTLAIKNDGSLWGWGDNGLGELGDSTSINRISPVRIGTDTNWKQISLGDIHSLAIKTDGTLWAWGYNAYGQLGDGTETTKFSPVQIGIGTDWKQVSANGFNSSAIKNDGSLWAWGDNSSGQLGTGTFADKNNPTRIGNGTDWKQISFGGHYAVALKTDGSLWTWGSGDFYDPSGRTDAPNQLTPIRVGTSTDWQQISASARIVSAIKTDGTLWVWGGTPGLWWGSTAGYGYATPTKIDNSTDWQQISSGTPHSLALKKDGTLWSYGVPYYGQGGTGYDFIVDHPIQVGISSNWKQVSAADVRTSFALKCSDTDAFVIDPSKYYRILSRVSNKVLQAKDESKLDSAQIYQWDYSLGNINQFWQFKKTADGQYNIVSKSSGKLIDIQDNTAAGYCAEGTIIQQFAADDTNSQKWRFISQNDGSVKIINETCNKYLRVENSSSANGASVGIKNDFGTPSFKWTIQEMPYPSLPTGINPSYCYRIVNKATNKVLEIKNASLTDSTQIYQWASATNRPQQLWKTTLLSDGKYSIKSVSSGKVMDILDNTAAGFCVEGTIIQQFPFDGTNSQRWELIAQTDGSYKILNTTCNKYLRVENASTADGASVGIKNDFGTDAFKWYFQAADCATGAVLSATNAAFGFEARASEGRAKLQWITNTGYKTDYFEVERMNAQGNFDVLVRQNAEGNNDMKSYSFTDNDPLDGDNHYRINSISNGNTTPQYSEVKKVSFSKNDGISIFPNPADEFINVDLRKYEGKTVSLSVYNSVGFLVKKQTIEKVSAAPQQIDMQGFGTGSYLLRVQSEGKREVTRLFNIAK